MKKNIPYLLAITPFMFFTLGYIFSHFLMKSTVYQTPNLVGLKLSQALTIAAENHATIKLLHQQECPGVEAETIISQKPSAGRLIRPNQAILITVAKESALALAPDLKLKKLTACEKYCKELGMKLTDYPIVYPLPQKTCIGQIPQAQETIPDKKLIIYTAQEKINMYVMPNFIKKNLNEVIKSLTNQEIMYAVFSNYEKIEAPYSDALIIISQKPKPGSLVQVTKSLNIQFEVV